ncbi:MAG TPA: trypsin-like peptidase domain-containing protein [Stellaceae bacterium]|nr:trypsin-like peptidase domain-containing protein [Stellaceae bacterium]
MKHRFVFGPACAGPVLALLASAMGALHAAAGGLDRQVPVDPDAVPWRAVGKLQAVSVNFRETCTAALVGPALALSAAHCLVNPRTGRFFPSSAVHFLIGYSGERYAWHAVGRSVRIGTGYDPARPKETIGSDWALIALDKALGAADRVLPILRDPLPAGASVVLGGYQRDHPLVMIADTHCHILGHAVDADGKALLRHSCAGLQGMSGAPLLIDVGGAWYIAAVAVAEAPRAGNLAALPDPTSTPRIGVTGPP